MSMDSLLCLITLERLLKKKSNTKEEKKQIGVLFSGMSPAKQKWFCSMYEEKLKEILGESKFHPPDRSGNMDL